MNPTIKTKTVTETRIDNRDGHGNSVQVWRPTVIEDHGSWNASWDLLSYSSTEADANLAQLLIDHPLK